MGNEQSLLDCEWKFKEPYHSFLHDKTIFVIDNEIAAEVACDRFRKKSVLYIDCEGKEFGNSGAEIGLVQIATDRSNCYIFDIRKCKECLTILKCIFESSDILKVFHDCSGDVAALLAVADIKVKNVGDTQIAQHFVEHPTSGYNWKHCKKYSLAKLYFIITNESFPFINVHTYGDNKWLDQRPLTDRMVHYAAVDALVLAQIYEIQKHCFSRFLIPEYKSMIERAISSKCDRIAASSRMTVESSTYSEIPASSRATIESSSSMGVPGTVIIGASVLLQQQLLKLKWKKKSVKRNVRKKNNKKAKQSKLLMKYFKVH